MYGQKRVKIEKTGIIVLAGGRTYMPIGKLQNIEGVISAKIRNIDSYELSLNTTNSIEQTFKSLSEMRGFIKEMYSGSFFSQ